jgi:hypothetical protein
VKPTRETMDMIVAWARRTGASDTTATIVALADERDELLALLRDCRGTTSCATGSSGYPCRRHGEADKFCDECRRRAVLAKYAKGTP